MNDLVGNARQITAFKEWLLRWKDVHIHSIIPPLFVYFVETIKVQYTRQNPGAKACLISGPPGRKTPRSLLVLL